MTKGRKERKIGRPFGKKERKFEHLFNKEGVDSSPQKRKAGP